MHSLPSTTLSVRAFFRLAVFICVVAAGTPSGAAWAADADAPAATTVTAAASTTPAAAAKPGTHLVAKAPFKIDFELDGVFEAAQMAEVSLRPESWAEFSVLEALPHGRSVEPGDVIVKLDLRKIDEAIADLARDRDLAELSIKQAGEDVAILEKAVPLDLALAERTATFAAEDFRRFVEIDRPMAERNVAFSLKMSGQMLEYQAEELRQLEKMYKADELTEETEELILKRTRNELEAMKFLNEQSKLQQEQTLKVTLPRKQADAEKLARTSALEWERTRTALPLILNQKRLALAKLKQDQVKTVDRLAKLNQDREAMTIRAPIRGVVYYGRVTGGKWTAGPEAASMLRRGGKLMPGDVFLTIVGADAVNVRATVTEKQADAVRVGLAAKIVPTAYPEARIAGKVDALLPAPVGPTGFESVAIVKPSGAMPAVSPGMTCKIKLVTYLKADAIAVPAAAVATDELDDEKRFVTVIDKDGKSQRRDVVVGKTADGKTEIVKGLEAGETVALGKSG